MKKLFMVLVALLWCGNAFAADYAGTATGAELDHVHGVTSAIQTQFTGKQAASANLTSYAGVTPAANTLTLLGSVDYAAWRSNMGLTIGTHVQAFNTYLTAINQALTTTSSPTFGTMTLTGTNPELLTLQNTDATSFSRQKYVGTGITFTTGVGNASATITALQNKWYVYDFTHTTPRITIDGSGNISLLGAVTATSLATTKQSGVAGVLGAYEANSTDTDFAGYKGPLSLTYSYVGQLPNARATSANQVLAWTNSGESGTGTAADPYVQTTSWLDLDDYALATRVDSTQTATHSSPSTTNPLAPTWTGLMHTVWYGVAGTINLPAASTYSGRGILIYNTGAYVVTIDPNGSEVIVRDGTAQTGGVTMTLSSGAGNYVALLCDGARWVTLGYKGTLAAGS